MVSSRDKLLRRIRTVINILNIILEAAVIGLVIYAFGNTDSRLHIFSYIFYLGAAVNGITGIKHMISDKKLQGIVVWVFAAVLIAAGYFGGVIVNGI